MANFFIRRPIVAIVISILIVLLGLNALRGLSFEQYPFLAPPTIRVIANYPGASAVAVEQSVATPVEQEVNGVEGMVYMKSSNTSDGRMLLDVNFQVGTNQDMANVLTQNRVSSAQARLPQEVIQQGITVKKQSPSILMLISLYSPNGTYDANFLINYFSHDGHETSPGERDAYRDWVLATVETIWARFREKFLGHWRKAGTGDAYPASLFADQSGTAALEAERQAYMDRLWTDTVGFAAAKMIRRILGLAHNIDLEWIKDADRRALCEARPAEVAHEPEAVVRREIRKPGRVAEQEVALERALDAIHVVPDDLSGPERAGQ